MQFLNTHNICQWNLNDLSADPPNSLSHSRNLISYPNGSQWFPSFYCIFMYLQDSPWQVQSASNDPNFFLGGLLPHGKEATSSFMHVQVGAGMPGLLDFVARLTVSLTSTTWKIANDGAVQPELVLRIFPARHGQDFSLFDSSHRACHQESSSWHWCVDHCTLQSLGY